MFVIIEISFDNSGQARKVCHGFDNCELDADWCGPWETSTLSEAAKNVHCLVVDLLAQQWWEADRSVTWGSGNWNQMHTISTTYA